MRQFNEFPLINIGIRTALIFLIIAFMAGFFACDTFYTDDLNGLTAGKDACVLIPTRGDIQQALVDAGYNIGPKGVDCYIGDATNTAWGKYEEDTFSERLKQCQNTVTK